MQQPMLLNSQAKERDLLYFSAHSIFFSFSFFFLSDGKQTSDKQIIQTL
jgi:hypothetical protein